MLTAIGAYWALALVCGFGLGTLREVVLTPRFGPALATAVELPVILTALWFGSGWIVRRFGLVRRGRRVLMGVLWLAAFLLTEFILGALMRGWSPAQTAAHFGTVQGGLGLGGFLLAATFPALHSVAPPRRE